MFSEQSKHLRSKQVLKNKRNISDKIVVKIMINNLEIGSNCTSFRKSGSQWRFSDARGSLKEKILATKDHQEEQN